MISLPVDNYPTVEDTNDNAHVDQNDFNLKLTFTEHELIMDVLCRAVDVMEFACDYHFDKPIDDPFVQRYTLIENLRERINLAWSDRFNKEIN